MTVSDREGLIARIRQVRRLAPTRQQPTSHADDTQSERLQALEARVAHLEHQLDGLQDSVHRESERHAALINDLQAQIQPGVMGASLAKDARDRGL
jgi:uncharacterized coiled-coil protein SlyX